MFSEAGAQDLSNSRTKCFRIENPLFLDSSIVIPESINVFNASGSKLNASSYEYDLSTGLLHLTIDSIGFQTGDSICINYDVLRFSAHRVYRDKSKPAFPDSLLPDEIERYAFTSEDAQNPFDLGGFESTGSVSRGLSFGNNQNVVLNSGLNLQVSGDISPGVELSAFVTDRNLPFQPEGQTQTIQDFDRVFIQLKTKNSRVIVGDYDLFDPDKHFHRYRKNVKGASVNFETDLGKAHLRQSLNASVGRGKFARMLFQGEEGNQGPYRLRGVEGEQFIVVLAASERVFLDGELLKRGEQYDYTIDYNTAELIFTAKNLISNQSRLIVEFEYANQAFVRTILAYQGELEARNSSFHLNIYNEQDARNQPLQQELGEEEKNFLKQQLPNEELLYPSPRQVSFGTDRILYERVDSAGFFFYKFSSDSTKQLYAVSFSFVGDGKGSYTQVASEANGRVYAFAIPEIIGGDTILQGAYIPFVRLIAPAKRQLVSLGYKYDNNKKTLLEVEFATSDQNSNLFSVQDFPTRGYASNFKLEQREDFNLGKKKIKMIAGLKSEYLSTDFKILQPYRNAEFARDWNLESNYSESEEFLNNITLELRTDPGNFVRYSLNAYTVQANQYRGLMNRVDAGFKNSNLALNGYYDSRKVKDQQFSGVFERALIKGLATKGAYNFSASFESQANALNVGDSLAASSFQFAILNLGTGFKFDNGNKIGFAYFRRSDQRPNEGSLKATETGQTWSANMDVLFFKTQQFLMTASYRELRLFEFLEQENGKERTVLSQIEYNGKVLKGLLDYQFFYSYGRGQEALRDFTYVEVPTGQGNYQWQDSNGDSIQQVNEFLPAAFLDSAKYIKVFTQSDVFVPTFQSKYNQRVSLNPNRLLKKTTSGFSNVVGRFSAISFFSINRKTQDATLQNNLNPFVSDGMDTNLVFSNSQVRNTVFFNRRDPKFGVDLNNSRTISKTLSTNGFSLRELLDYNAKLRYNLSTKFSFEFVYREGQRISEQELFEINNFNIAFRELSPKLNYISQGILRLSLMYSLKNNDNSLSPEEQFSLINELSSEIAINFKNKGLLQFTLSNLNIQYTGALNNPASFEMLQGLQPGSNQVWNISFLRTFSNNLQLNLSYDGRKSESFPAVHIGKVQARILF